MKKIIPLLLSAAIGLGSVGGIAPASSGSASNAAKDILVLGDSIAAGYGLSSNEYNYGQICADYLGGNVENYAVSGATSADLLSAVKSMTDEQKKAVSDSEVVVISIGGNDIIHYSAKYLLDYAAKKGFLNSGYTAADIPENPGAADIMKYINIDGEGGLADYVKGNTNAALELVGELKNLVGNICNSGGSKNYVGIIPNQIIPNIKATTAEIKKINPNARVIVQTIYQPIQFEQSYVEEKFGKGSAYLTILGQLRSNFRTVMEKFRTAVEALSDIEVADVYFDITSMPENVSQTNENPGYASYFINIQSAGEERDIHPNQKGHLAIAAVILNTIGDLHKDTGLLSEIYTNLPDKADYPFIALCSYKKAAGELDFGDVNLDGVIDSRDAALVLKEYTTASTEQQHSLSALLRDNADLNADGRCNTKDAYIMMKYYAYVSSEKQLPLEDYLKL